MSEEGRSSRKRTDFYELRCINCTKVLPYSEILHRCSGCQLAVYCNRECQRADWCRHKVACPHHKVQKEEQREDHKLFLGQLSKQYPSLSKNELRAQGFLQFVEWDRLHILTIHRAAMSALWQYQRMSPDAQPVVPLMLSINARPHLPGNDNPSTMFYVASATIHPTSLKGPGYFDAIGMTPVLTNLSKRYREHAEKEWKAQDRYAGLLPVVCSYAGTPVNDGTPVVDPLPSTEPGERDGQPDTALARSDRLGARWLPTLQAMMLRGHVVGPPDAALDVMEDVNSKARIGRMQKIQGRWQWVQMSDEEVRQFGYGDVIRGA